MQKDLFSVIQNTEIAENVFKLELTGDTGEIKRPGQFVNLLIRGFTLRRPLSVCDTEPGKLTLIYKRIGEGTAELSRYKIGETLDILCGLGNGFNTSLSGDTPLLISGGLGTAPLLYLAKTLSYEGKSPITICGFNSKCDIILFNEFKKYSNQVFVATMDGSAGVKGTVIDALSSEITEKASFIYSCGPYKMMQAVCETIKTDAQFSFEERMGCGFGACMGCTHKTTNGYKRVCKDGPVFNKKEIIW